MKITPAPYVTIPIAQSSISKVGPPTKKMIRFDPKTLDKHSSFRFHNPCKSRIIVKLFSLPMFFPVKNFHVKSCVCLSLFCIVFCSRAIPLTTTSIACGEDRPSNHLW